MKPFSPGSTEDITAPPTRPPDIADLGWVAMRSLWSNRGLLLACTTILGAVSLLVALLLTPMFRAEARVLLPDGSGNPITALLGRSSSAAAALLGGAEGDYTRYLAILTSDRVIDRTIEQFDLTRAYELEDNRYPREATRNELRGRTELTVDAEYEFLSIAYLDESPERASDVTNFMVAELNRLHNELAAQGASLFRQYVEHRHSEVLADLDSLRSEMQLFQERYGVLEISASASAFLDALSTQRAAQAELEVQRAALRERYADSNQEQVRIVDASLAEAKRQVRILTEGRDPILPVALSELPEAASTYGRLLQELTIQGVILETIQPLYEQARFEEERSRSAVQVLDQASPPARKAEPKRALFALSGAFSGLLIGILVVIASAWYRANRVRLTSTFSR